MRNLLLTKLRQFLRLLYCLVAGDPWQAVRYRLQGGADVLFFCTHPSHECWVIDTLTACRQKWRCKLVMTYPCSNRCSVPRAERIRLHGNAFLALMAPTRVFVSPVSGLSRARMPWGARFRVYVPHSLTSLHNYAVNAFSAYDVVLAAGPHHVNEVAALDRATGGPPRRSFEIGYGKWDRLLAAKQRVDTESSAATIGVAGSWGDGNLLEMLGAQLVDALIEAGYRVILRPHAYHQLKHRDILDSLAEKHASGGQFQLDESPDGVETLCRVDTLISDYSGIAYEYAFLMERPVLFVDVPPKVFNPDWQKLGLTPMEFELRDKIGTRVAPTVGQIVAATGDLLERRSEFCEQIREVRRDHLFDDSKIGEITASAIEELFE